MVLKQIQVLVGFLARWFCCQARVLEEAAQLAYGQPGRPSGGLMGKARSLVRPMQPLPGAALRSPFLGLPSHQGNGPPWTTRVRRSNPGLLDGWESTSFAICQPFKRRLWDHIWQLQTRGSFPRQKRLTSEHFLTLCFLEAKKD